MKIIISRRLHPRASPSPIARVVDAREPIARLGALARARAPAMKLAKRFHRARRGGGGGENSTDDDDDDARSDEDAFEDVRDNDAFDDEEIDEDEAFDEADEEAFGEFFGSGRGDDGDDDAWDDEDDDDGAGDGANDDSYDDDGLNQLMDSDDEAEEAVRAKAKSTSRTRAKPTREVEEEDVEALVSSEDDDDEKRERVLDELVGARKRVTLDPRYRPVITEVGRENPMAVPLRLREGEEKLTLKDVMASLGEDALDRDTVKRLNKISKTKAVDAPLARPIKERIDRKAAYAETSKDIGKYQAVVKENREKRTLKFEPARKEMQRKDTLGALAADFTPRSEVELEIARVLKESGHASAKDVVRGELLEMNHLDVEDIQARQAKLAKMRAVLFYHEQKAKRLKNIKSKAFHRHNRKGELKVIGDEDDSDYEGEGDTPEERREYLRAQERMLLRHKNTSRWAKRAIKKGIAHLAGTREKLQEQLRIGQQLKEKIEGTRTTTTELDEESTDAEDSEDEDPNDPETERKRRLRAKAAALKALEDGGDDDVEGANDSLFKLPFMARAMEKRKSQTKAEAQELLDELDRMEQNGEELSDSDDDDEEWDAMTTNAKRAADARTASASKKTRTGDNDVDAPAKNSSGKQSTQPKKSTAKPITEISDAARKMRAKAAARVAPVKVKSGESDEDADDGPTVMLEEERDAGTTNEDLMRRAFANDDIEAEFEKEKLADVSAELPETDMPKNLPGWGAWASDKRVPKWMKDAEKKAKTERAKALKSRRDAKLKHVVISEKYDKKAAQFNVESLPHGYASKAAYEGTMRQPLGLDVNTHGMFQKLNAPKVLKPTGSIIKPMKLPKHKAKEASTSKSSRKKKAR